MKPPTLRAFSVSVKTWNPSHIGVYAATSAAKARFACWRQAHDAGFYSVTFAQLSVLRAPEFDAIAGQLERGLEREYATALLSKHNQTTK